MVRVGKLGKVAALALCGSLGIAGCAMEDGGLVLKMPQMPKLGGGRQGEVERLREANTQLYGVARRVLLETLDVQVDVILRLQSLRKLRPDEKAALTRAYQLARYVRGDLGLEPGEPLVVEEMGPEASPEVPVP